MSSILEEFACGNISPVTQVFRRDSEYGRAMKLAVDSEQELLTRLEADDRALFEKCIDAEGEVNRLTAVKNLIYGYKLGLTMTAEAFVGADGLLVGDD